MNALSEVEGSRRLLLTLALLFAAAGVPVAAHAFVRRVRGGPPSSMPIRYGTLAALTIVVLGLGYAGGWLLCAAAVLLVSQGTRELWRVLEGAKLAPDRTLGTVAAGLLPIAAMFGPARLLAGFALVFVVLLATDLRRANDSALGAPRVPATLFGVVFVGLSTAFLVLLREGGPMPFLFTIVVVQFADLGGLFGGMAFGRRKLAPRISPQKTVGGLISGIIAAVLAAALVTTTIPRIPLALGGAFALALALAGAAGDLAASALKRSASVKDFGAALPGHGGVLDRFDGYLVAAPVSWLLFEGSRFLSGR